MSISLDDIKTPKRGISIFGSLISGQALPGFAARLGIRWARRRGKPFRFGSTLIAARYQDVRAMLDRDLDFTIAPVNEDKIEEVNGGPFVLGMDRSARLVRERRALYAALSALDMRAMEQAIRADASERVGEFEGPFDAIADYSRPIATDTAARMFGIGGSTDPLFAEAVRSIFAHTFLNLGDDEEVRQRAIRAGKLMQAMFAEEIDRRIDTRDHRDDFMGQLLKQGMLDKDGIRRTLGGMLVGSIDTTVTCFAKIVSVAEKDCKLHAAIVKRWSNDGDIYGLCLEALRRWPHNPILLREARTATELAGTKVKQGDRVIAWTEAAMQDPCAFPAPEHMLPDRPVSSYLHLGAGLHPCAGRALNAVQLPTLVGSFLASGARSKGKIGYAGPFPDSLPAGIERKDVQ